MGVSIQKAIENGLLSDDVLAVIPHKCVCGADIEFTDSLRQIYCTNPRCFYKVAARLEAMAKKLRGPNGETCEGWGESACITVCQEFGLISPFQVFKLPELVEQGVTCSVPAFEKKVASICNPVLRKVELWKIAELVGIPSIDSSAYKIFGGYDTFEAAYEDIDKWQVPFIANKLGIKNNATSVMAVNAYKNLMEYRDELIFGEKLFEVYKPTGVTLYITITGGVQGFRNKGEFVRYINTRYAGRVNAMLMNSVTSSTDILVADGDTGSNKFRTAQRINNKYVESGLEAGEFQPTEVGALRNPTDLHCIGEKIVIGTSDEVLKRLDRVFGPQGTADSISQ